MKGKFVTIYGINNIGKSTQARILVERLKKEGQKAIYVKYPVYDLSPTGPFIDSVLRNPQGQKISEDELQLWFILNRYQFQPKLKKMLDEGYIVVAEDYIGTGIAWGTAKGLPMSWLEDANKYLLKEDLAILFQGERRMHSREKNHVHEQNEELMEKCRLVFENLADKYNWQRFKIEGGIEKAANDFWEFIKKFFS